MINSPQKNISTCSEDLDKAIKEVIHESEQSFLIDDILSELGESLEFIWVCGGFLCSNYLFSFFFSFFLIGLGKAKETKKSIEGD